MSTDLDRVDQAPALLNPETGELLEATVDNAAAVILAARRVKGRANELIDEATAFALYEAERLGKKTLHGENETLVVAGGASTEYDEQTLMELLRDVGCPEQRIAEAVTEEITYKVNRSVLNQLAGANPQYKAAIELAKREVDRPFRVSVKSRRGT
jgi:sulfur carrier protein ThiS